VSADTAAFFEQLRASTAKLLRLDPAALSPSEAVRVDRAASLRMLIDGFQAAQLRGEVIDAKGFVIASQELERLMGGNPAAPPTRFNDEHKAKLRKLIEAAMRGDEANEAMRTADIREREEMAAILAAGGDIAAAAPDWQPAPAGGDVEGLAAGCSALTAAERSSAGGGGSSALPPAAPVVAPPPPQNKPSNPPPGPREVWRDHLGPDGSIVAPYFNPYG
jgi:hypothetical protein